MRCFRGLMLATAMTLAAATGMMNPALAQSETNAEPVRSGVHDFDFEIGEWRVRHRIKPPMEEKWAVEFEGTCITRSLMSGAGNIEEHTFHRPNGVSYGLALRAYDASTRQWAIWWVDSRSPHLPMDPPMLGRFEDGVGRFYSDAEMDGRPARVRFIWSGISATAAHWEQAFSFDGGKTWHTNWEMSFTRTNVGASRTAG